MKIRTVNGHVTITFDTTNVDFDTLIDQINQVHNQFKSTILISLGISEPTYYAKKRNKCFNKLEKEALSKITGISIEKL